MINKIVRDKSQGVKRDSFFGCFFDQRLLSQLLTDNKNNQYLRPSHIPSNAFTAVVLVRRYCPNFNNCAAVAFFHRALLVAHSTVILLMSQHPKNYLTIDLEYKFWTKHPKVPSRCSTVVYIVNKSSDFGTIRFYLVLYNRLIQNLTFLKDQAASFCHCLILVHTSDFTFLRFYRTSTMM